MRQLTRRTALLSALAAPALARAEGDYPNRTIRLVIPWPPGASADAFLRIMAEQTGKRLGQSMVPDNKPGANGSLSGVALKDARPDGYTLGQIHTGTFRAALMTDKPAYDPLNDFTYIIQLSGSVHGIVVRTDSPYKTFEDLVAAAKADPEKLTYGTFGQASVQNLVMVDLQQRLGIKMTHVPYKGGSDLYNGLLGSQIDAIADASGWIPLVQAGKFRLLVVWGSKRLPLFPEVRTLREAGIDLDVNSPYGVCGPKGMDPAIVKMVHDAMKDALFDPATQAVMNTYNMPTLYLDTAAYDKAARAQNQIEIDNLKRVGMLAVKN
ncbi:MAG TPA: tripartite tricarboxylate transporter substrate binding protein [Reyranella sp.]|jgi:tripartite-type tricarboxylate transporter receptor subunit TctC|nr:tripartite tricarboxylate transporter substrate binding protein [Reyranella sp.]